MNTNRAAAGATKTCRLRIRFAQPDAHGHLLAIAEALSPGERSCDLALIRMSPAAVDRMPAGYQNLSSGEDQHLADGQEPVVHLEGFERNRRSWAAAGFEVIEFHRAIRLNYFKGAAYVPHLYLVGKMLSHPMWLAARQAYALHCALPANEFAGPHQSTTGRLRF